MRTTPTRKQKNETGSTLFFVMILMGIAFLMLASALSWSMNSAQTTDRNNQYYRTLAAAEAATEKVLSRISLDFQTGGENLVYNRKSTYLSQAPASTDNAYWSSYQFSDGQGNTGQTYVNRLSALTATNLNSQYSGLYGMTAAYEITSYARETGGRFDVSAGIRQNVQVASIPVFQFAIFYNMDLEIEPGPDMTVTGPVHSNGSIYNAPNSLLAYQSHVTAGGKIIKGIAPGSPPGWKDVITGTVVYNSERDEKRSQLTLPIGTSNKPDDVYEILRPPQLGEDPNSPLGQQRYYNKADVIITVNNNGTVSATGPNRLGLTPITASSFVSVYTNKFWNGREAKGVNVIDIDVSKFKSWAEGGANTLATALGYTPALIYVVDKRTPPAGTQPGVRVIDGERLPASGLTVASPAPLYVQGNFNTKDSSGTSSGSDTTHTKPASLVGDAITVLSKGWKDADNATKSKGNNHSASSTTVNAAFLAGIVPTSTSSYSGGAENFPRFLEDWYHSGSTFTYNGSMVAMFYNKVATGLYLGTGGYYGAPKRVWAFDRNFLDWRKLPPGTPAFRVLIRGEWQTLGRSPSS